MTKTHREITDEGITKALEDHGGFFAFSDEQFNEQRTEGVEYVSCGAGLIAPKAKAKAMLDAMDAAIEAGKQARLAQESREDIINHELSNYECFYTGDITEAVTTCKTYGISEDEVRAVFRAERQRQEDAVRREWEGTTI